MTEAIKAAIIKAVAELRPCSLVYLYTAILEVCGAAAFYAAVDEGDLVSMIDELVASGDLVEVEYGLPEDYDDDTRIQRIKSLLFPAGTEITIRGKAKILGGAEDLTSQIEAIAARVAAKPIKDLRTDDEILGYDDNGLPS